MNVVGGLPGASKSPSHIHHILQRQEAPNIAAPFCLEHNKRSRKSQATCRRHYKGG